MLTILALAVLQTSSLPAYLEDMGWTLRGDARGFELVHYTRPGPRPNMIWSRYETKTARNGARSVSQLDEMNCTSGQYRTVQQTGFPLPNLEGAAMVKNPDREWEYPAPGTFAETAYRLVCERQ